MLYPFSDPPLLSVAEVACSMAKSNIVKPALFTQDIVQLDIFRKTCSAVSSPFIVAEKVPTWDTQKDDSMKLLCYQQRSVVWSLIDLLNSYLMVSSVVGFYSLRVFEVLTPRKDDTTMTTVKM